MLDEAEVEIFCEEKNGQQIDIQLAKQEIENTGGVSPFVERLKLFIPNKTRIVNEPRYSLFLFS